MAAKENSMDERPSAEPAVATGGNVGWSPDYKSEKAQDIIQRRARGELSSIETVDALLVQEELARLRARVQELELVNAKLEDGIRSHQHAILGLSQEEWEGELHAEIDLELWETVGGWEYTGDNQDEHTEPCIGGCGRDTNGWFEYGTHGPGWYCGWCLAVPE